MEAKKKQIYGILILGSFLAAIKMLFWGYSHDEEYQMVMSYRNLMGDLMLGTMYEPHQTSTYFCTFFMWIYRLLTGGFTGVLVWLRLCGTLLHLFMSVLVYKTCKHDLQIENGFLIALVYFNILPKLFAMPEFSNMQMWYFTLMVLFLIKYFTSGKQWKYLVGCGVALSLEVLVYPSMLLHFLLLMVLLFAWTKSAGENGVRRCLILLGTCAGCAIVYLGYFMIRDGGPDALEAGLRILSLDSSHSEDVQIGKGLRMLRHVGIYAASLLGIFGSSFVFSRFVLKREKKELLFCTADVAGVLSCIIQVAVWVLKNPGFEYLHIHAMVMLVAGGLYYLSGEKSMVEQVLLFMGILGTLTALLGICLLTNLSLIESCAHAGVGIVFALMMRCCQKRKESIALLPVVLCLLLIFAKGYTLRNSITFNNVFQSEAHFAYGPAKGSVTNNSLAYVYNRIYEICEFVDIKGKNMLGVTGSMQSVTSSWYMFTETQVSHYSVVNPHYYNENLLEYWELHPEKEPDIIAVECSGGNVVLNENTWIMDYIYNEFGYTEVIETELVNFYIK